MSRVAPEGDVYQAGTLSGNPLAMAAGLATLRYLKNKDIYQELEKKGDMLFSGLKNAAEAAAIELTVNHLGSMGSLFFTSEAVNDFATAKTSDQNLFRRYYRSMLEQGIYLAPSPFEAIFLSTSHSKEIIARTIRCAENAFRGL